MNYEFGSSVQKEAERLFASGKDVNQIAALLCDKDSQGSNYGVGIVLMGDGKPMETSSTLLKYVVAEAQAATSGRYMNSVKLMPASGPAVTRLTPSSRSAISHDSARTPGGRCGR